MAQPELRPLASGLKLALSQASIATPRKPMAKPRMRLPPGRSRSQIQAISAPNSGTVAFRIADRPVLIDSRAKEKQAKGMPELSMPTNQSCFQCSSSVRP